MAGVLGELAALPPRLIDRTRDQLDFAVRLAAQLPCVGRLLGSPPSASPGDRDDLAPVVPLRRSTAAAVPADEAGDVRSLSPTRAGDAPDPGPVDSLPIPGYDELAASQVIPRLEGLEAAELEAVRSYESANRGRRTILARIGQLQAG